MSKLKFPDAAHLKALCDAYFLDAQMKQEPFTVSGLALAIGTTVGTLRRYEEHFAELPEQALVIKEAKTRVENYAEKHLFSKHVTGSIFALKNFGWRDKIEQEITGKDGKDFIPESMTDLEAARRLAFAMIQEDKKVKNSQ